MPGLVQIGKQRPGASAFLPTTLAEARERGWDELDIFGGAHLSELSWLWEDQDDDETPPPFLGRPRFS